MAYHFPPSLVDLINELSALPGVGPKSAQRLAFHLLKTDESKALSLAQAIVQAREKMSFCPICGNLVDDHPCSICTDRERDQGLICVVEQAKDIASMERSRSFNGLYHVLGGLISPLDGIGPEKIAINSLMQRINKGRFREIIIATNPNVEGEATALFLAKKIKPLGIRVSRIAHGLPVGGDLEYADELTLSLALDGRKDL